MGTRGQVIVDDGTDVVVLYQHWDGDNLPYKVANAMAGRSRWDDPPYLARMIFEEMISLAPHKETGYGIQPKPAGDAAITVHLKVHDQVAKLNDEKVWTFEEFVAEYENV